MKYRNNSNHGVYVSMGGTPAFITPYQEFESSEVIIHPHVKVIQEEKPKTLPSFSKKETKKKVTLKKTDK
jgi:hypothetical protein